MPHPFLIYTLPRTGSTTLLKLLNSYPAIRCAFEPFNPDNSAAFAQRTQQILQTYGMPAALRALFTACTGFKHVWRINGWPLAPIDAPANQAFPGGDQNRQLLHTGARIIHLIRRNALRRAISEQISEQLHLWVFQNETDRQRLQAHIFQPLDLSRLETSIRAERPAVDQIRAELHNVSHQEIAYEDFFEIDPGGGANTFDAPIARLQQLLQFLQAEPFTSPPHLAQIRRLFDPGITGFENAAAYHKIPNIHEVEKTLGNDETGHVFPP